MPRYPRKLPPIVLKSNESSDKHVSESSDKYVEVIISPPDSDIERQTKTSGSWSLKLRSSFTGSKAGPTKANRTGADVELKEASVPFSPADLSDIKEYEKLLPKAVVPFDRSIDGTHQDDAREAIFDDYLFGLSLSKQMIKNNKLYRNDKNVADCVVELLCRHTNEDPSTIERIRETIMDATLSNIGVSDAMSLEMERTIPPNKVVFEAAKHYLAHTRDPTEPLHATMSMMAADIKLTKGKANKLILIEKKSSRSRPYTPKKMEKLPAEWELAGQILERMKSIDDATERKLTSAVQEAAKVYQKTKKSEKTPERHCTHRKREPDDLKIQLESKLQSEFKLESESEGNISISETALSQEVHDYKESTQDIEKGELEIFLPPKISLTDVDYFPTVAASTSSLAMSPSRNDNVGDQERRREHLSKKKLKIRKQIKARVDSKGASLKVLSSASPEMKEYRKLEQQRAAKQIFLKASPADFTATGLESYHEELGQTVMADSTSVIDPKISVKMYLQANGILELFQFMTTRLLIDKPEEPLDYLIGMTRTISLGQRWTETGHAF